MKYSEAKPGRVFVVRLHDGEILHEEIERLAVKEKIRSAWCVAVGGADAGSRLVVGPKDGRASPVVPLQATLDNVHEVAGVGTIFPDEAGAPVLHMHMACGRTTLTTTGCVRAGVKVWQVLEVVIHEITACEALRRADPATGFKLLEP